MLHLVMHCIAIVKVNKISGLKLISLKNQLLFCHPVIVLLDLRQQRTYETAAMQHGVVWVTQSLVTPGDIFTPSYMYYSYNHGLLLI